MLGLAPPTPASLHGVDDRHQYPDRRRPGTVAKGATRGGEAMFDYDAAVPLDVRLGSSRGEGVTAVDLTYSDGSGGTVVATLLRPAGPTLGGVVVAHGGSDDGRRYFLDEAAELAEAGMAVLLPATRLPPHGDTLATAAAVARAVRNFRRGLDVLRTYDADRLCFFGHSAGAVLGALLAGAEPRLTAVVLAGTGSGTLVRLARAELRQANHPDIDGYLAFLDRFDTRHHVARYTGRLLIQHGLRDDTVTTEESTRMRRAAGPSAERVTYDHGHDLAHPPARRDRRAFLLAP
jgi:dipeptidyl aminopeptidase/acylaminoacyl peptidase